MVLAAAVAAPVAVRPSQHSFQARQRRAPRSVQAEQGGRSHLRAFPRPLGSLHVCGDHARLPDWRGAGPRYGCGTAAAAAAPARQQKRGTHQRATPPCPLRACTPARQQKRATHQRATPPRPLRACTYRLVVRAVDTPVATDLQAELSSPVAVSRRCCSTCCNTCEVQHAADTRVVACCRRPADAIACCRHSSSAACCCRPADAILQCHGTTRCLSGLEPGAPYRACMVVA